MFRTNKGRIALGIVLVVGFAIAASFAAANHPSKRSALVSSAGAPTLAPPIVSSTFLGGTGFEIAWSCAVDQSGNLYVGGDAQAADFPVTSNALQKSYGDGGQDGFVAKYDKNGNLLWATYLGGTGWDGVFAVAVDSAGNVVVTGVTESTDFPVTSNAVQASSPGGDAAFVTVISADGTALVYSTYLGGATSDGVPVPLIKIGGVIPPANVETIGVGVAVGPDNTIYVVGGTNTIDMPVTSGAAQAIIGGESDGFVARIDPQTAGQAGLMYCTYLGGATSDFCAAVAVDANGNAFVTGETQSSDFPTTLGAYQRVHTPGTAGFVTKLNPSGSTMVYSTLVSGSQGSSASGGSNYTAPSAIVVDSAGHAYIDGETNDTDFPTTAGVVQPAYGGADDGFITELSDDGSALVFSTYLGASDYEGLFGLKIDRAGNILVGGYSSSHDLTPVNAFQPAIGGYYDCFVAKLTPGATALLFQTYLGGIDQDSVYGLDLWNDQLYLTGRTASTDFPTTNSAPQKIYGGGVWDVFVTTINLNPILQIDSITRGDTGQVLINGHAGALANINLQTSPDLIQPFTTGPSTKADRTGAFQFEDSAGDGLGKNFYRASFP
ncbi:MAG: hypothetical protein QOH39_2425 [Verrucomicrobiota bacterium]|jgi:hypothetical protein